MFTTYGIVDPRTHRIIYIGQTNNYERRQKEHRMAHRTRGRSKKGSLQHWLKGLNRAGDKPRFIKLEEVEGEEASLASELEWIEKLSAAGVPLLNRWEEHREAIGDITAPAMLPELVPRLFQEKTAKPIGRATINRSGTGYRIHLSKGVILNSSTVIDLLPPKPGDTQGI